MIWFKLPERRCFIFDPASDALMRDCPSSGVEEGVLNGESAGAVLMLAGADGRSWPIRLCRAASVASSSSLEGSSKVEESGLWRLGAVTDIRGSVTGFETINGSCARSPSVFGTGPLLVDSARLKDCDLVTVTVFGVPTRATMGL